MSTVTLIDDEYVSVVYHTESKIVHNKIKQFLRAGEFQKMLETGADCLEKNGAAKWLSEDRTSVVLSPDDLEWSDKNWSPRVRKAGLKYWAIVTPEKAVAAMQMKTLQVKRRAQGLTVEHFETVEEAMAWLESK